MRVSFGHKPTPDTVTAIKLLNMAIISKNFLVFFFDGWFFVCFGGKST